MQVSSQSAEVTSSNMASRQRNSVRILSNRERGSQTFGSQRLLQLLVEEKVRWMKWQSQVGRIRTRDRVCRAKRGLESVDPDCSHLGISPNKL